MNNKLVEYLSDYRQLHSSEAISELETAVQRHPWFTLGRYMLLRASGQNDTTRRLYKSITTQLEAHPYPQILLPDQSSADQSPLYSQMSTLPPQEQEADLTEVELQNSSVIDDFLARPLARIIPTVSFEDDHPEDISLPSITPDQEIATETLAQIFLAQGHIEHAIEIYSKLSLKYPEKSSYFAGLIANIQTANQQEAI